MNFTSLCFKCKKSTGRFASRDGVSKMYCDRCFIEFCTKTTRDQLFSHCYLPCDEPVAVGVSGGAHSLFLLHQLGILRKQGKLRQGAGTVNFELLPFHLREDELVLSPQPELPESATALSSPENFTYPTGKSSILMIQGVTQAQQLHKTLLKQFDKLEGLVRNLPIEWEYANCSLFERDEIRVYKYSDFLKPKGLQVLRHCMHHPRLSLTQREELYERVRQRVLYLATCKRIEEWCAQKGVTKLQKCSTPLLPEICTSPTSNNSAVQPLQPKTIDEFTPLPECCPSVRWNHVVFGDAVTHCCIAALKSIVQGGTGNHISHQSGPRGYLADTVVLRPLRGLLTKEIILYNRLHGIPLTYTPALRTNTSLPSIHRVLEQFVLGLVSNYWTSVFNVLNMVKKIAVSPPGVTAVLEGLVLETPHVEPEIMNGGCTAVTTGRQEPTRKDKKKNNTLGRSAQLYHAQLQRTEPPIHHVCKLASVDAPVCHGVQSNLPDLRLPTEKVRENNVGGTSCFLCGCPFSGAHGMDLTEHVLATTLVDNLPSSCENVSYDYFVCHGCYGCVHDVLEQKVTPLHISQSSRSTSGESDAEYSAEQLVGTLAALSSAPR